MNSISNNHKRNPFVALSELASKECWCWRIGCSTCGCNYFRDAFVELVEGNHPDNKSWIVCAKNHHTMRKQLGKLPSPENLPIEKQQVLLNIVSAAPISNIQRVATFPDWLGYIGLVLLFCEQLESQKRTLTKALIPQFLTIVDDKSKSYCELSNMLSDPNRVLHWWDLECVEDGIIRQIQLKRGGTI